MPGGVITSGGLDNRLQVVVFVSPSWGRDDGDEHHLGVGWERKDLRLVKE